MLVWRDIEDYKKIKKYTSNQRMLMIGNQLSEIGPGQDVFNVSEYKTLDPDNGDYPLDLTGDLSHMDQKWDVVFNLGTIEHIWDIHKAYCNAARLVKVGGIFIGHTPVEPIGAAYAHHGIHCTSSKAILRFFELNGFMPIEHWHSVDTILWHVAIKTRHVTEFKVPMQLWDNMMDGDIS